MDNGNAIIVIIFLVLLLIGIGTAWRKISNEQGFLGRLLGKLCNTRIWLKIPICIIFGYIYLVIGTLVFILGLLGFMGLTRD